MSWLEYCGVAFLLLVFLLICTAAYIWAFGPVPLFSEQQGSMLDDEHEDGELDRLIKAADEAVAKRPRVRAISTYQGE